VILPLIAKEKVLGTLNLGSLKPGCYGQKEIEILSPIAEILSVAVENSNLYEEVREKSRDLESMNLRLNRLLREQSVLREIFTQINLLDLGHLLHQLSEQALNLLKVDHIQVRLLSKDGILQTVALAGKGSERFQDQLLMSGRGRSSWVMENRRPVAIRDIRQDKIFGPGRLMGKMRVKGYLCVPLISREHKSIGVLLATSLEEREFTPEEISLAQQLAAGAAIAIENARLFEEVQKKSAELEEAFKAKSAFLNTMAHELKTPLHVIVGVQELLLEEAYGKITEEQKRGLERMGRSVRDLLSLIDEILELARLEVRRVPLHIEEFPAQEMIHGLESSLMPLAKEKGLELKIKIEDPSLRLRSDKTKLNAILENLLSNAIKYTAVGEIELSVSRSRDGEDRVSFSVHDTGIGIQEEDLKHIFEPFYMVAGVDRRKHPGTGLGLTIVKRLVELFNGEIQVESVWGKGSTFAVTLPIVHPSES
jgi:signal transduction histidine kinase